MEQFLKELTELTLKHKLVLCGDGVYYCIKAEKCSDNLDGKYEAVEENRIVWNDE